jgi:microcystin-dependent protein
MKFTKDDLIYMNGQYYSPLDSLTTQNYVISNSTAFYLVGVTISNTDTDITQEKIRAFRNKTLSTFAVDYRFDVVKSEFPLPISGLSYVGFEWGGTSRHLKRLLRLGKANVGDVMIKRNSPVWYHFGDYSNPFNQFGFGKTYSGTIFRDFDTDGMGRNEMKGYRLYKELSGRFMVGYSSGDPSSPSSAGYLQINYGQVGNVGGYNSLTFSKGHVPAHDHSRAEDFVKDSYGFGGPQNYLEPENELLHTNLADPNILNHTHRLDKLTNYNGRSNGLNSSKDTPLGFRPGHYNNIGGSNPDRDRIPSYSALTTNNRISTMVADYFFGGMYWYQRIGTTDNPTYTKNRLSSEYQPSTAVNPLFKYDDAYATYKNNYKLYAYLAAGPGYINDAANPNGFGWRTKNTDGTLLSASEYRTNNLHTRSKGDVGTPGISNTNWTTTLRAHKHQISSAGGDQPHENRPPYMVVIYYIKI